MSDAVEIALITSCGLVVSSSIGGFIAWMVARVGKQVNGRMTEFIQLIKTSSHAEGKLEGEKNGKDSHQ